MQLTDLAADLRDAGWQDSGTHIIDNLAVCEWQRNNERKTVLVDIQTNMVIERLK